MSVPGVVSVEPRNRSLGALLDAVDVPLSSAGLLSVGTTSFAGSTPTIRAPAVVAGAGVEVDVERCRLIEQWPFRPSSTWLASNP